MEDRRRLKYMKNRLVNKITQISHEDSGNLVLPRGGGGTSSVNPVPRAAELRGGHQQRVRNLFLL